MYYQYMLIAKVVTNLILFHSWVFLQSGDLRTRRPWGNCKASVISWLWCAGIYTEGTYFKDAPTIVVQFHPITAEHNSKKKNIYSWCVLNQSHHMKKTNSMQFKCHDPHPSWGNRLYFSLESCSLFVLQFHSILQQVYQREH